MNEILNLEELLNTYDEMFKYEGINVFGEQVFGFETYIDAVTRNRIQRISVTVEEINGESIETEMSNKMIASVMGLLDIESMEAVVYGLPKFSETQFKEDLLEILKGLDKRMMFNDIKHEIVKDIFSKLFIFTIEKMAKDAEVEEDDSTPSER